MSLTIRVTNPTSQADLARDLALLNTEAKALTRRGYTATRSDEYEVWHERINAVLGDLLAARTCRTCGRTQASCDAEAGRCCVVCRETGHS